MVTRASLLAVVHAYQEKEPNQVRPHLFDVHHSLALFECAPRIPVSACEVSSEINALAEDNCVLYLTKMHAVSDDWYWIS